MSTRIKTEQDCYTGRDFGELGQAKGANVEKVGSFLKIETPKGEVYVQDCNRTMAKSDRKTIIEWLTEIGVIIASLGVIIWSLAAMGVI